MELIYIIIALAYIANMISWSFTPLQSLKDYLYTKITDRIILIKVLKDILFTILNCSKCSGLWIGFIYFYFTPIWYIPFLISLTAAIIQKILRE